MLISMLAFFSTKICHNKGRFTLKKRKFDLKIRKRIIFNFSIKLGSNIFGKVKFVCVLSYYMGFFNIDLGSIISYFISNKWLKRIKKS